MYTCHPFMNCICYYRINEICIVKHLYSCYSHKDLMDAYNIYYDNVIHQLMFLESAKLHRILKFLTWICFISYTFSTIKWIKIWGQFITNKNVFVMKSESHALISPLFFFLKILNKVSKQNLFCKIVKLCIYMI